MPRAKQTQTPPPQSPSPPQKLKRISKSKKPPLPKKSPTPKKELKEKSPQKERNGNCKRRILNTDDSDDEIGNINENEPETKRSRNAVFSDLLWPLTKMDEGEYARCFNVQMVEAMGMLNQGLLRLAA